MIIFTKNRNKITTMALNGIETSFKNLKNLQNLELDFAKSFSKSLINLSEIQEI